MSMVKKFIACLILFIPVYGAAQHDFDSLYQASPDFKFSADAISDTLDIFNSSESVKISLISDFKNLTKTKQDKEYQDATVVLAYNDTVAIRREVKIKSRGNFRLDNCSFPPIKLNFKKVDIMSKSLQQFDKLKMVNNCRMQGSYEKYILNEYLAYKLYNLITPYSFRVRLAEVEYVDTGRENKRVSTIAFLIEPEEQLASRLNGYLVEKKKISPSDISETSENQMALFQYMIGNTDYSIPALHNLVLLKENDHTKPDFIVIPYDFDYSGLVNAPYAIPSEKLDIKSVRDRLFIGACHDENIFLTSSINFMDQKETVFRLINSNKYLEEKDRNELIGYISEFYSILESKHGLTKTIMSNCRNSIE